MKKSYNRPVIETMVLGFSLMQDFQNASGGNNLGGGGIGLAPKPRTDKPF